MCVFFIKQTSLTEKNTLQFFRRPVVPIRKFYMIKFCPRTATFCEHSSIVDDMFDLRSLALNHCGYSHIEVCNAPVHNIYHVIGNCAHN